MIQIFGTIKNPLSIISGRSYPDVYGGGITMFLTNIVRLLIVIGGLWAFLNIILAGYGFLGAGDDPKNIEKAWQKIWQSFLGMLFIVVSFVLAGLAGWLLFGDATAILNPKIYGP